MVEVDGYKYHREDNKQKERDILKNNILSKYNIPLIRLTTNGSREESIIRSKLEDFGYPDAIETRKGQGYILL